MKVDWRSVVFRVVGVVVALLVLAGPGGLRDVVTPWALLHPDQPGFSAELHRWHIVQVSGLLSILLTGSILATVADPLGRPALMQMVLLGMAAVVGAFVAPFNRSAVVTCVVLGAGLLAAYPRPGALLGLRGEGRPSRALLLVALAATLPLALDGVANVRMHMSDVSEHAAWGHWYHAVVFQLALGLAGFLTAAQRGGWKTLGALTGAAWLYFGAAAVALPEHDGSWGATGGVVGMLVGLAFLGATAYEAVRGRRPARAAGGAAGRRALALAATLSALAVVGCGAAPKAAMGGFIETPATASGAAQTVDVAIAPGRLAWEHTRYEARAGSVTFVVTNPPGLPHDFTLRGKGLEARSARFDGGTSARLTLADLKPGTYQILCTVPGHFEGGMVATLTVS